MMTPFEPDPSPIDADGYCLLCWDYCSSYEECVTNRYRNRESPKPCFMEEPHPPHGWQEGIEEFFCKGGAEAQDAKPPQRLW